MSSPPGGVEDPIPDSLDQAAEPAVRDVAGLLAPRSVVLVGASERAPTVVANAVSSPTRTFLVNPNHDTVLGTACFASVASLPERPEVAVLLVSHKRVLAAAEEAIAGGVRGLVVPGVGAEAGREGAEIASKLRDITAQADVAVLGTNCMGYVRPGQVSLWIGSIPASLAGGSVSVVAESGSVAEGLVSLGGRVGFRAIISSGGELNRDAADYLAYFAKDEESRSVGLFLETIRRPEVFSKALVSCAESGKPVVCLKAGRSEAALRVALAHSGALVGSARATSAFLRAHGVIEVDDLCDMVETLEILGRQRWPKGRRIGAISESGGEAELLADHAHANGLVVEDLPRELAQGLEREFPNFVKPGNPLDAWAVDEADKVFPRSLEMLAASGAFDVLVAQVDLTQYRSNRDQSWCETVVRSLAAAVDGRDLFGAVVSSQANDPPPHIAAFARQADLALLRGIGAAARALDAVASWTPRQPPPTPSRSGVEIADLLRSGPMPEHESAQVLERYGIEVVQRARAKGAAQAAEAAEQLGFPVVVKLDGPAHKSALGGVVLGLESASAVEAAVRRIAGEDGAVLVARQVLPGPELICGTHRDQSFGPVIALGAGGALAEMTELGSLALAPLSRATAEELITEVPWLKRVVGSVAHEQLVAALLALSLIAVEHEEIEAIDVNPFVVGREGIVAVDALVVVRDDWSEDGARAGRRA